MADALRYRIALARVAAAVEEARRITADTPGDWMARICLTVLLGVLEREVEVLDEPTDRQEAS